MPKKPTTYKIAYRNLALGSHAFEFAIGTSLFEQVPESEIKRGECSAQIALERGSSTLALSVTITGRVEVACDRCLEEFYLPIDFAGNLQVKFSQEVDQQQFAEQGGDLQTEILWVNPADDFIDLTQYLYESISLSLPFQRIHPLDEQGNSQCNPFMLSKFRILDDDFSAEEEVEDQEEEDDQ